MNEIVAGIVNAPIPTLLILSGVIVLFFSVLFEISSGTGRNKTLKFGGRQKISLAGTFLGLFLFLTGIFYQPLTVLASNIANTPTPTPSPMVNPEPLNTTASTTGVSPAGATQGLATEIPATSLPTSLPNQTLKDGCISVIHWQSISTDSVAFKSNTIENGCIIPAGLGLAAENSGPLRILQTATKGSISSGIYTPVKSTSIIEFNVRVRNLYTADANSPATINFAVAPASNPIKNTDTARFRLMVESTEKNPLIYFVLADIGETNGAKITSQHYEYGRIYEIRLELNGLLMNVFINDIKMNDILSLPVGEKVFFIGYNLPSQAGAEIEISDIRVDGVAK